MNDLSALYTALAAPRRTEAVKQSGSSAKRAPARWRRDALRTQCYLTR